MALKEFIQKLPIDKKEHIVLGVIYSILIPIFSIIGAFADLILSTNKFSIIGAIFGFLVGSVLNLYKELWNDLVQNKGNAEVKDFVATEIPKTITIVSYLVSFLY